MAEYAVSRRFEAHKKVAWAHGLVGGAIAGMMMALWTMIVMAISG